MEILDEQTPWGTSVAQPDGTVKLSAALEPFRAMDDSGQWAPVDTTLQLDADGMVRPANAVSDMAFSGGGASTLASLSDGERSFALAWPQDLPEPGLDGPTATYPEVMDGVDLVVTVSAEGFAHDLVVNSAEAAADPALEAIEFGFETSGLEAALNEAGGIELTTADSGELFAGAAPPQMWDSSEPDVSEQASTFAAASDDEPAVVGVELDGSDLRLFPDRDLLEGPDTVYPVTIDPVWAPNTNGWITVSSRYENTSYWKTSHLTEKDYYGDAGVGQACDSWNSSADCLSTPFRMRSYFRFDVSRVTRSDYRIPSSATVSFLQRHSALCDNGNMHLYRAEPFHSASGDTWNDQPTAYASTRRTTGEADNGRGGCGGSAYVDFGIGSYIDTVDAAEGKHLYVALRPPTEFPSPDLRYWNRFDASYAHVEILYDVLPYQPKRTEINGMSCTDDFGASPWINTGRPGLSAYISSKSSQVRWQARVWTSGAGATKVYDWTSGVLSKGHRRTKSLPSSAALPDGYYHWVARAISATDSSIATPWTPPCRFKVDHTKPTRPEIAPDSTGPFSAGDTVEIALSSSDPEVNGVSSGVDRFEYSWQTNTYDQEVGSDGTATVTGSDLSAGRHVLYVRSVDKAGNESDSRTFTFFVGNDVPATPMATWRFEGDTLDDSGHGNDLSPISGDVTFEPDRDGRPDSALVLDGNTCLASGEPVIETDRAYSLSAWIRLDSADGYEKALMQVGEDHSAFQIQYAADDGRWRFSVLSADYEWNSVSAAGTVDFGQWEHIAATYDPDAGITRLYLGGELAAEREIDFTPWRAESDFGLGCLVSASGSTSHFVDGAIDQVGIWQGLLTDDQIQGAMVDLPTASEQAHWEFRDGGTDASVHGRDLDIPSGVTIGEDAYQRPSGAVELDGSTCLEFPEPAVATDRSFTAAGWVKLDSLSDNATVVSIAGDHRPGFRLRYAASVGKWQFAMHGVDAPPSESSWLTVLSDAAVEADRWYHLSVVYDAAVNEMRLFVDGALQGTRTGPDSPWAAFGATVVGCSANGATNRWSHLTGSLHDVRLWRGPVDADQISGMMGDPPAELAAWWGLDLDGGGEDWSDKGSDLTLVDDYEWTEGWWGKNDGALALELGGGGYAHTDGPVLNTDESYTVAAWVRLNDTSTDQVVIAQNDAQSAAFSLEHRSDGTWAMTVPSDTADSSPATASSQTSSTPGEWFLLVGVYDLAKGEVRLYVNGELEATATGAVGFDSFGPMAIGAALPGDDTTLLNPLNGAVDDVIVWKGALPETVIASRYDPDLVVP
ncbi:LamG domain-containing protein [Glycomyces salinus]|uniref:LamG domain-containing protein n=1 Tax=Glycomyces salinus TaxID=980294 RepID=UPI0018EA405B|nr:LamG domain-containing protein [Glycomyces salinus]